MKHTIFTITILFAIQFFIYSENSPKKHPGVIKGIVADSISGHTMEYTNVALFRISDNKLITGHVTNNSGAFILKNIPIGEYYLSAKFIGYKEKIVKGIKISKDNPSVNLGTIDLAVASENIGEIAVVAEQAAVMYKIDKKIVPVSSYLVATGGNAVDVLENVPSVQVDIEGNVSLRGSGDFVVMIDGKPSLLQGSDALDQIPASMIENIEIITNPSVKYDPDGTAGIINVVTKKNSLLGESGKISISGSTQESYGLDAIFNYKTNKLNFSFSANYNLRNRMGIITDSAYTILDDVRYYTLTNGDRQGNRLSTGLKAGIDYAINKNNDLTIGLGYSTRGHERDAFSDYRSWTSLIYDQSSYLSDDITNRTSNDYRINTDYIHRFSKNNHKLEASAYYTFGSGDEENINKVFLSEPIIESGQASTETGDDSRFEVKLDYTHPFSKSNILEAGIKSRIDIQSEEYNQKTYDPASETFEINDEFTVQSDYSREIHSIYSLFKGTEGGFGYQFGLRGEYTKRVLESSQAEDPYTIDRLDWFLTTHTSYQISDNHQLLASYGRRINRPRSYFLEPFKTQRDAFHVWQGNPNLKPEYIDSYELSYQYTFDKSYFSIEAFYRKSNNKMERIQQTYEDNPNQIIHTFANVGTDHSIGSEFMIQFFANKSWNFNIRSNLYYYRIDANLYGKDTTTESTNFSLGTRQTFRLGKNTKLQLDGNYRGPSASAQGKTKGMFMSSAAIKYTMFKGKLETTLKVSDIFSTGKREYESIGDDFYSYFLFERDSPVFEITISYLINNFREKKSKNGMDGFDDEGIDL